jgi:ComF family protein
MSGARAAALLRLDHVDFVTAVPMHPRRLRVRGHNHSEILAKAAAERMNLPYAALLMRTRDAAQQVRLSDAERKRNLDGAFAARPEFEDKIRNAVVVLIDDVYTTGSTARECASALRRAGAAKVYFAGYAVSKRGDKRRNKHG